jgi:hypothetical protein
MLKKIFLAVVILVVLSLVTFGYYLNTKYSTPAASSPTGIMCTQEAKLCPDGSAVGRTGPNCEFAACPNAD